MFFPYKDSNPTKRFALITFLIILGNILIFLSQVLSEMGYLASMREFALIPIELYKGNLPDSQLINPQFSPLTYMFIHGGIGHLLFNMLFLWIFGNNIEDEMTKLRFTGFYLLIGFISGITFAVFNPGSEICLVGASGAISGVLGAYMFLFPRAKIHVLVFIFPLKMPAAVFIIIWFFMQISGFLGGEGNVAWITHISGFISGVVLHRFFLKKGKTL